MPAIPIIIQPFAAIYVGDADSSATLTRLNDLRVNGAEIIEEVPSVFVPSAGKRYQAGNHTFRVTLVFLGDSDAVTRLSRGIALGDDADSSLDFNQYSLFLRSPESTQENSYYFPRMDTERVFSLVYKKDEPTSVAITFVAETRNLSTRIAYKNTESVLDLVMDTKSPI